MITDKTDELDMTGIPDELKSRSDLDLINEVRTVGLPAQYSSRMTCALASRLSAALEREKELRRLLKWLYSSRNGVAMSKNDLINLRAIEKIVGEK